MTQNNIRMYAKLKTSRRRNRLNLVKNIRRDSVTRRLTRNLNNNLANLNTLTGNLDMSLNTILRKRNTIILRRSGKLTIRTKDFLPINLNNGSLNNLPKINMNILRRTLARRLNRNTTSDTIRTNVNRRRVFLLRTNKRHINIMMIINTTNMTLLTRLIIRRTKSRIRTTLNSDVTSTLKLIRRIGTPTRVIGGTNIKISMTLRTRLTTRRTISRRLIMNGTMKLRLSKITIRILLQDTLLNTKLKMMKRSKLNVITSNYARYQSIMLLRKTKNNMSIPLTYYVIKIGTILANATTKRILRDRKGALKNGTITTTLSTKSRIIRSLFSRLKILTGNTRNTLPAKINSTINRMRMTLLRTTNIPLTTSNINRLISSISTYNTLSNDDGTRNTKVNNGRTNNVIRTRRSLAILITTIKRSLRKGGIVANLNRMLRLIRMVYRVLKHKTLTRSSITIRTLLSRIENTKRKLKTRSTIKSIRKYLIRRTTFIHRKLITINYRAKKEVLKTRAPIKNRSLTSLLTNNRSLSVNLNTLDQNRTPIISYTSNTNTVSILRVRTILLSSLTLRNTSNKTIKILMTLCALKYFRYRDIFSFSFRHDNPYRETTSTVPVVVNHHTRRLRGFLSVSTLSLCSFFTHN